MLNARGRILGSMVLLTALVGCPNPGSTDADPSTKPSTTSVKKSPKPAGSPSTKATKSPSDGGPVATPTPTPTPSKASTPTSTATPTTAPTSQPSSAVTTGTPTPAGTPNPNATTTPAPNAAVSTFVGSAVQTEVGLQDGKGPAVRFFEPEGIVVAADETVYVTDTNSHAVRKISPDGTVLTIAGNQLPGKVNGLRTAAQFNLPKGIAIASDGTLYIADTGNHLIRKMAVDGTVTTLAGTGSEGNTNGFGDAAAFRSPDGLTVGSDGAIYVADTGNNLVRRIVVDGTGSATVSTLAGSGVSGSLNGVGDAAQFRTPQGIVAAAAGVLYVSTVSDNLIRKIVVGADGKGTVTTLAGTSAGVKDGPGATASFNTPVDLAIDKQGNLFVADRGNGALRKITIAADGSATVSTIAGGTPSKVFVNSVGVSPSGKIYVTELGKSRVALIQ